MALAEPVSPAFKPARVSLKVFRLTRVAPPSRNRINCSAACEGEISFDFKDNEALLKAAEQALRLAPSA